MHKNRLNFVLLSALLFIGQTGTQLHLMEQHHHTGNENCLECLATPGFKAILPGTGTLFPRFPGMVFFSPPPQNPPYKPHFSHYRERAPPMRAPA